MSKNENSKSQKIDWEYCECSCHGHEIRFGSVYFWMFNDLGKGKDKIGFHLFNSHMGMTSEIIGTYDSFEEADEVARNIAREKLKKYREELEKAEAGL